MSPQRIQRRRVKGWRMPVGAVYVGRPTKWGNPWLVRWEGGAKICGNGWVVLDPDWLPRPLRHYCTSQAVARRYAVWRFRRWLASGFARLRPTELAGRDLVCWCPPGPCHADILLRLANGEAAD